MAITAASPMRTRPTTIIEPLCPSDALVSHSGRYGSSGRAPSQAVGRRTSRTATDDKYKPATTKSSTAFSYPPSVGATSTSRPVKSAINVTAIICTKRGTPRTVPAGRPWRVETRARYRQLWAGLWPFVARTD